MDTGLENGLCWQPASTHLRLRSEAWVWLGSPRIPSATDKPGKSAWNCLRTMRLVAAGGSSRKICTQPCSFEKCLCSCDETTPALWQSSCSACTRICSHRISPAASGSRCDGSGESQSQRRRRGPGSARKAETLQSDPASNQISNIVAASQRRGPVWASLVSALATKPASHRRTASLLSRHRVLRTP